MNYEEMENDSFRVKPYLSNLNITDACASKLIVAWLPQSKWTFRVLNNMHVTCGHVQDVLNLGMWWAPGTPSAMLWCVLSTRSSERTGTCPKTRILWNTSRKWSSTDWTMCVDTALMTNSMSGVQLAWAERRDTNQLLGPLWWGLCFIIMLTVS